MKKISTRILAVASAAVLSVSFTALAQSTWTGLGLDSNWSTPDNWDVNPTFPAALTFAGTTQLTPNNDLINGSFGVVVGTNGGTALTFDAAAGEFTLGGNAITLDGHVGFGGDPATVVTQAITMPLFLNRTVGFSAPSNGVFSVSGGISALGAYSIWKGGPGRMILGAGNTFGNGVFCYGGTLQFGANNVINSSPGTLWLFASSGTPATVDLAGTTQSIPNLNLGGNSPGSSGLSNTLMDSVGGGVFKVANNILCYVGGGGFSNATTTISATWDVDGVDRGIFVGRNPSNTVDLLLSGPIINTGAAGKGFLLYRQNGVAPGVVMMTSTNNSYDGQLSVRDNLLILGANNTLPTNSTLGLVSISAFSPVVDLNGTTNMVKGLTLGAGAAQGTSGVTPSIVDSVGGGVLKLGTFNVAYNAGGAGQNGTATVSATLDLNGGNRAFNIGDSTFTTTEVVINGAIINSVGTAGIIKNNGGVLVLAGTNTYNGLTTVQGGTLRLNVASLNPAAAVNINNVGITNVLLDLNFNATNVVAAFNTNGVALANGIYNAANMPGVIAGSGALQVGAVVAPPTPILLTNSVSGSTLTFTWPAGQNWRLVNQTNSLATGLNPDTNVWFTVPGGIDGSNSVAIDPANPTVFYRLVWP